MDTAPCRSEPRYCIFVNSITTLTNHRRSNWQPCCILSLKRLNEAVPRQISLSAEVRTASLAWCAIALEPTALCLVPQCRTNVSQINTSSEAELIWSLHSSGRQIAALLWQQQMKAEQSGPLPPELLNMSSKGVFRD